MKRKSWLYAAVLALATILVAVVLGLLMFAVAILAISLVIQNPLWVVPILLVFVFVIATIGIHNGIMGEDETEANPPVAVEPIKYDEMCLARAEDGTKRTISKHRK